MDAARSRSSMLERWWSRPRNERNRRPPGPDLSECDMTEREDDRATTGPSVRRRAGRGRPRGGSAARVRTADRWRFLVVPVTVTVVVDLGVWLAQRDVFAALPAAYWLMALLAVAVDARPYVVAGRRASSVILPSICFTFAIALAWGAGPALVAQLVSVTVAGVRTREPARRTLHLAVQHVVALGGAALVGHLAGLRLDKMAGWADALLTVLAAAGWMAARYAVAAPIFERSAPKRAPRWGAELLATGALLLLGPVVLAAARAGLALVPLVLLALRAVHRMVRSAGEHERASRVDASHRAAQPARAAGSR